MHISHVAAFPERYFPQSSIHVLHIPKIILFAAMTGCKKIRYNQVVTADFTSNIDGKFVLMGIITRLYMVIEEIHYWSYQ